MVVGSSPTARPNFNLVNAFKNVMMKKMNVVVLVLVCLFVGAYGFLDAVKDTLAHHYDVSIFSGWHRDFWNANLSWCNKWKNCQPGKERFWGSSTFLVALTDAWHFMKFLMNRIWLLLPALFLMNTFELDNQFLNKMSMKFLMCYVGLAVVQNVFFTLFYHYLLLK